MKDIEKSLLVQQDQLKKMDESITKGERVLKGIKDELVEQEKQIGALEERYESLFSSSGIDKEKLEMLASELLSEKVGEKESEVSLKPLVSERPTEVAVSKNNERDVEPYGEMATSGKNTLSIEPVPIVPVSDNWREYNQQINYYIAKYQLNMSIDPLAQLLSPKQFKQIEQQYNAELGKIKWNKWDYTIVGLAGLVGFLVDVLVVKLPVGAAEKYVPAEQASPVGKWINQMFDTYLNPENSRITARLEKWAKMPYDAVNLSGFERIIKEEDLLKMTANLHRLKTPGHDPMLQFIFGVLDNIHGTISVFDQSGNLAVLNNPNFAGASLFTSIIKVLAHFLSDVGTPRGVVPPFFSLTQAITANTPFTINDRGVMRKMKFNELTERMYAFGGYNFNHFLAMALTPLVVELIIRAYHWLTKPTTELASREKYKLQSMLALGHSITMSTNVIKLWLSGWNPLAFNYAQLLMLVKTFYSTFRANAKYHKEVEETLLKNWEAIYRQTE